jgi:hypothetical protein
VPVKTSQRHPKRTVAAPILLPASANHCKTLQSASICFKAPCKKMQYFAIECFEMLHFVSCTPVHHLQDAAWVAEKLMADSVPVAVFEG